MDARQLGRNKAGMKRPLSALFRCAAFAFGLLGSSLLGDAFHFLDNVLGQVPFPCFAIPAFVDLGRYFSLYQKLSELSSLGFGFNSHRRKA